MYEASSSLASNSISIPAQSLTQSSNGRCACILCMKLGVHYFTPEKQLSCRAVGCALQILEKYPDASELVGHEKTHFYGNGKYFCREARCTSCFNRWEDLIRHTKSKHCLNPPRFYCSFIGCQYHEGGFTRKDKLQSHCKNAHRGPLKFARSARLARLVTIAPRH